MLYWTHQGKQCGSHTILASPVAEIQPLLDGIATEQRHGKRLVRMCHGAINMVASHYQLKIKISVWNQMISE